MNSAAKVSADVTLKPGRSQVYLVAAAVAAGISLVCATTLFAAGRNEGWGLLAIAVFALGMSFVGWYKAQSDTDLEGAHRTELTLSDGTNLTTDSRLLRSPDGFRALSRVLDEILSRKPLEAPDGLVDSNGQVVPGSADEASRVANEVNANTQRLTNGLLDALGISEGSTAHIQGAIDPNANPRI